MRSRQILPGSPGSYQTQGHDAGSKTNRHCQGCLCSQQTRPASCAPDEAAQEQVSQPLPSGNDTAFRERKMSRSSRVQKPMDDWLRRPLTKRRLEAKSIGNNSHALPSPKVSPADADQQSQRIQSSSFNRPTPRTSATAAFQAAPPGPGLRPYPHWQREPIRALRAGKALRETGHHFFI